MHDNGGFWRHFAGKECAERWVIAWCGAPIGSADTCTAFMVCLQPARVDF